MAKKIVRLPTQHKTLPHCPSCNRSLPTFDGVTVLLPVLEHPIEVVSCVLRIRVRCECGAEWILQKGSN